MFQALLTRPQEALHSGTWHTRIARVLCQVGWEWKEKRIMLNSLYLSTFKLIPIPGSSLNTV
jgi:hypothetical protein